MNLTGGIILFAGTWFMIFLMILPARMVSQQAAGHVVPGTPASAPEDAQIWRKVKITTALAIVVWIVVFSVVKWGGFTIYDIDWFHRPDAHGGEMGAALVSANISPYAPNSERWNTLWMFMQSGPGVFRGDLSFYTRDESLIGRLGRIDTARTPVHLLVGAYDLTCTPEDAARTARAIPGATIAVMDELGHFPMSEHPAGFRPFFIDALTRMRVPAEV